MDTSLGHGDGPVRKEGLILKESGSLYRQVFFLGPILNLFFLLLVSGERCHLKEITKYFPSFVYHCPSPPFVHAFSRAFFQWTPPGCPHCAALVVGAPKAK